MPERYDYILAGGGSAGLALAHHMATSTLRGRSILIIDQEAKDQNDRTWCFWTDGPTAVDDIIYRRWDRLRLNINDQPMEIELAPYRYNMVRGIDFYRYTREVLENTPGVEFLQSTVREIHDGANAARVVTDAGAFNAQWVFDSLWVAPEFQVNTTLYHDLKQHFRGWVIETTEPAFRPDAATFFDFRTEQDGAMRFFYLLPFSENRGLVEYTLFSPTLLSQDEYDGALREYIARVMGVQEYRIVETEQNMIPMTDYPFRRRVGQRILRTGTRGGRVKASSGFAFLRTQRDSAAIVNSLARHGHPFGVPKGPRYYRLLDSLFLQVMLRESEQSQAIYADLFGKNPIHRVFRFLDEEASPLEALRVIASLPARPFLRAWWNTRVRRRL
jgi:lycopene beta-cyclase